MCRETVLINVDEHLQEDLVEFLQGRQANGATVRPEVWRRGGVTIIHNRFAVTSERLAAGRFPLEGSRHVLNYNGEVFAFRAQRYVDQTGYASDVHFALHVLEEHGLDVFLRDVDFQGSYQVYDKATGDVYILVDQLNTCGCFFSELGPSFIMASEYPVVNEALKFLRASPEVQINVFPNGTCLKIAADGKKTWIEYRPDCRHVWDGSEHSVGNLREKVDEVGRVLFQATSDRIPSEGPVAVLCGGGVDSSLILANVVRALQKRGDIKRLRVFTFGSSNVGVPREQNDLLNAYDLLDHLGLKRKPYLTVISPDDIEAWRNYLLETKVYCKDPRLITPNPIRTQVRHTVTMSCMLAAIVRQRPEIRTVLSGEAADELFAGYNSMRQQINNPSELQARIRDKLSDLALNDAGRVILSSCHGTVAILKQFVLRPRLHQHQGKHPAVGPIINSLELLTSDEILACLADLGIDDHDLNALVQGIHPVEVRMPFTSHHLLRSLHDAHVDYTVGRLNGEVLPKFLLRLVALQSGVPLSIVRRRKVPFHEGGTGVANAQSDPSELRAAAAFLGRHNTAELVEKLNALQQLAIVGREIQHLDRSYIAQRCDMLGLFVAAGFAGLRRLLLGNAFRPSMPDTIYSTEATGHEYVPTAPIQCTTEGETITYNKASLTIP